MRNPDGSETTRSSLLLACGFWGIARHFHYAFELTAAWSWCLLANPWKNGALPCLEGSLSFCWSISSLMLMF